MYTLSLWLVPLVTFPSSVRWNKLEPDTYSTVSGDCLMQSKPRSVMNECVNKEQKMSGHTENVAN